MNDLFEAHGWGLRNAGKTGDKASEDVAEPWERAQLGNVVWLFRLLDRVSGLSSHLRTSRLIYLSKLIDRDC